MSLDKAIEHGRERRKRYYGNKAWDGSCRNHGGCSWCEASRQYANTKRRMKADASYDEYLKSECGEEGLSIGRGE